MAGRASFLRLFFPVFFLHLARTEKQKKIYIVGVPGLFFWYAGKYAMSDPLAAGFVLRRGWGGVRRSLALLAILRGGMLSGRESGHHHNDLELFCWVHVVQ